MKSYRFSFLLIASMANIWNISNSDILCVPIDKCPPLLNLLLSSVKSPSVVAFLRSSQCGEQGHHPKVRCEGTHVTADCLTPDLQNGTCIHLEDCVHFSREDISTYGCQHSSATKVYVCCPTEHVEFKQSLIDLEGKECGYSPADLRIFGGNEAGIYEFSWMALLQYRAQKEIKQACSGSLINNRYVITAAHCVDPNAVREMGYDKLESVILGEYNTKNTTDCVYYLGYKECTDKPIKKYIKEVIVHPNWKWPLSSNDIALLRLSSSVRYSDFIKPVCLPKIGFVPRLPSAKDNFIVSGWGRTETEKRSAVKIKTTLLYRNCIGRENMFNICAGGNGNDICAGDSGGPLMFGRVVDGEYLLFLGGIASHGLSRCGNGPSVFTYVPMYMDWILATIKS